MGGGGGGPSKIRGLDDLLKTAREELKKQSNREGKKNVFISFAYEDIDEVNMLRAQKENDNLDLEFNDWSLRVPFDSDRSEYIKTEIAERITASSVTVVFVSDNTAHSRWVKWEVEKSVELGKKVVAVYSGKIQPSLPDFIKKHGISVIRWRDLPATLDKV